MYIGIGPAAASPLRVHFCTVTVAYAGLEYAHPFYPVRCFVARDEQLAHRIGELEQTVRELVEQNIQLRRSASDFGALAERLNARLTAERRASSRVSLRVVLDRFAGQIARYRVRM